MLQQVDQHSVTHGSLGLLTAYMAVFTPMVIGMVKGRAATSRLLLSPVLAMALTLVAALAIAIISPLLDGVGIQSESMAQLLIGVAVSVGIGYSGGRLLARKPTDSPSHRRGAVVSDTTVDSDYGHSQPPGTTAAGGSLDPRTSITLAGLPLAPQDETKHFKFIGSTGTGKSTAIRELLSTALARGDRAVIADPDGGYLNNFYDPSRGDVILNPFDPDSVKWSLFGEIQKDYDVEQLVRSLIPDNGGSDRIWPEYARTFLTAVIQQAMKMGTRDDSEIYRLVKSATVKELKMMLAGTAAGPFLEDGNDRMFGSVKSITSSAVGPLQYTCRQRAALFSIREWVRLGAARHAGGRGGALFIPYKAGEIAALRTLISAWMRLAIYEAMNRADADQRLWFIIDELDALGEIDGLKDALARLRKFGGRSVLGFQSIAQVSGTYGKAAADTIVENCGNTLILRCSASEQGGTSQFASRLIGQREVMHKTQSKTRRETEWFGSTTTSERIGIEPAVMASEIERLADLEGYLKVASDADWRRVKLRSVMYATAERRQNPAGTNRADPSQDRPAPTIDGLAEAVAPKTGSAPDTNGSSPAHAEPTATVSAAVDNQHADSGKSTAKRKRRSPTRAAKRTKAESDSPQNNAATPNRGDSIGTP